MQDCYKPKGLAVDPDFYGYVKNDSTSRTLTFLAMFMITTSHVLAKTFASALVITVNGSWLLNYMLVDIFVFLLVKVVRQDLLYWINVPGVAGWLMSISIRVITKGITDFAFIPNTRANQRDPQKQKTTRRRTTYSTVKTISRYRINPSSKIKPQSI